MSSTTVYDTTCQDKWFTAGTWTTVGVQCLGAIVVGLLVWPFVLDNWYLVAVPPVAASALFGLRSGMAVWVSSLLALIGSLYSLSLASLGEAALGDIGPASARAGADLLSHLLLQRSDTAQAIAGTSLSMLCCILLGLSVDRRNHVNLVLYRTSSQFQRYVASKVAKEILQAEGAADLSKFSTRREVTLLFSDLRGFTALSERLEPEQVVTLLNEYFEAMTEEVIQHGGTVDKYIGDAVMAFFGDGDGNDDHVEQAVRCGLAMQQRMHGLNVRWQAAGLETVYMGVGISTGVGLIGNVGSSRFTQYTAIGSMVNVASRLADVAKPGQILTTRGTFERVQTSIRALTLEAIYVKGLLAPVEVVEVVGSRATDRPQALSPSRRYLEIITHVIQDGAYRAMLLRSPSEAAQWFPLASDEEASARQVATLYGYPLIQGVPADEIAALLTMCTVEQHNLRDLVPAEGAFDGRVYLALDGEVFVARSSAVPERRAVKSAQGGPPSSAPGLLFTQAPTPTVRAGSAGAFLVLDREQFMLLLAQAPVLRRRINYMAHLPVQDYELPAIA